jgi:hypothetical protein
VADDPKSLLVELSGALGLAYEPQDWGLVNADGDRLEEFVAFFRERPLAPTQRFQMAELILASANERLLAGGAVDVDGLLALAADHPAAFGAHVDYWAGTEDEAEFPLGARLRGRTRARRA